MSTNKQRRETERRRLQRQLEERREREASRRRFTTVASIVGALVLVAAIVVVIVISTHKSGNDTAAGAKASSTPAASTSAAASSSAAAAPTAPVPGAACTAPTGKSTVTFEDVTVTNATNLKVAPKLTSKSALKPTTLQCQDLVVGTGKAATDASTVSVQYLGSLYSNGTTFDSSWARGEAASFSLSEVVAGFTQGIGGAGKVAPMKVGGRRIMILPASLGYGANPPSGSNIPANAPLIFVVDLKSVTG